LLPILTPHVVSAAPTLGIDLGGTKVESALVTPDGTVLRSHRHPTDAEKGPDGVLEDVAACVEECLKSASIRAAAAGIGVAGQVDSEEGIVRTAPNLDWTDVPLQDRLETALDLPVVVANDVRAITWGVWSHGVGRGTDNLVVIFVGTGIGGGIVSDGAVLDGHRGMAGELGHVPIVMGGRDCHCPNEGCWEAYAGGWAIAERMQDAVRRNPVEGSAVVDRAGSIASITGRTVHAACEDGNPLAEQVVERTATALGLGLTGIANALNPERIVLGGGVIEGRPAYVEDARRIVDERALTPVTEGLEVVRSELGDRAGAVGAATMAHRRIAAEPSA
jgi:glucokinase